ncbi:MAG: leucine--tRNA ligase, partial [Mycoplasmataceae bacterium]|nr:leucine--tRNA ligase [Mycoplasmataceae bacterium]
MYNHNELEKKWEKRWEINKTNKFVNDPNNDKKYYILDMFPYPSGAGLHLGHARTYALSDFFARYKLAQGYNVFHPFGWDAFGLPAEQFAISNNKSPDTFTQENVSTFRNQIKRLGQYYDYDYEVDTTDPKFYHWTQWIFSQLYKKDLAVLEESEINWCEELGTVLANDEIEIKDGIMYSERGGYPVVKKMMKQWTLKITKYAEALDAGLDTVEWDDSFKVPQKNWIGVSHGASINFKTTALTDLEVFTTRPDTLFGVSFIAIAPENKNLSSLVTAEEKEKVLAYVKASMAKTELQRKEEKSKTGVFTGAYVILPFSNKQVPIFVADYVLGNYATGAIMSVPAHDQRDYEFALAHNLPIVKIIENDIEGEAYTGEGKYINSEFLNGISSKKEAIKKMLELLKKEGIGEKCMTTKLHDWVFSRQRYWGEPFPIIFDENNEPFLISEDHLPVVLPKFDNYSFLTDKKYSPPLEYATEWKEVVIDGKKFKRETSTMPGSAGSSWYFLAYLLKNPDGSYVPLNSEEGKKRISRWMPVDLYIGGTEHTTGHVLYARFWNIFLYTIGITPVAEPFKKLVDHGMILAPDGRKMSKRWGNVINPNDICSSHGADALRTFSAFIGPLNGTFPWSPTGLDGIRKWLDRVYNLFTNPEIKLVDDKDISNNLDVAFNVFAKNVTKNMDELKQNLAVSDMMIYINECYNETTKTYSKNHLNKFLVVLSCFAPHLAEELNEISLHNSNSIVGQSWPTYDENKIYKNIVNLPVQENGKLRAV